MLSVQDDAFRPYGRVIDLDIAAFEAAIAKVELPADGTMYEPSTPAFEALPLFTELQEKIWLNHFFCGMNQSRHINGDSCQ